jgi:hypothetical protein
MHPTASTRELHNIDWADVAAKARAELGDESVARFSDRLRMTLMVTAGALRPGDTEDFRFGQPPPSA